MASEMDKLRVRMDQIANNRTRRQLICLCVDASISMSMHQRMSTVNREIGAFLQNMYNNATARDAVEVCIITFGDKTELVCDYQPLAEALHTCQPIQPTGSRTELGAGVLLALERLEARLQLLTELGVSYYRPYLIIISDDDATDALRCEEAAKRVRQALRENSLEVRCLSFSDEDSASRALQTFTLDRRVDRVNSLEMTNFFEMLSRSVSAASRRSVQRGELDLDDNYRHH